MTSIVRTYLRSHRLVDRPSMKKHLERLERFGMKHLPSCHPRESGDPGANDVRSDRAGNTTCGRPWIPALAGMTTTIQLDRQLLQLEIFESEAYDAPLAEPPFKPSARA